jgi:hypothetical protein
MTKTNNYIQAAMQAIVDNDNDRALGLLLRASLSYDDDIDRQIVADANEARKIHVPNDQPRIFADEAKLTGIDQLVAQGVTREHLHDEGYSKDEVTRAFDRQRKRLAREAGRTQPKEMKPLKPKKAKVIDVACPSCGAKPGKPCFWMTGPGRGSKSTGVPREDNVYHKPRASAAKGKA